ARCRAAQLDGHRPDPNQAAWPIGQEDDSGWHLLRESEQIGSVGPGRLQPDTVAPGERAGNRLGRRGQRPKGRVDLRVVVDSSCELAELAGISLTLECGRDGRTRREVQEVAGSEHPTPPMTTNTV